MDNLKKFFQDMIPYNFDFGRYFWILLVCIGTTLMLGLLFRAIFGKGSALNHCVSSAVAILCVYAASLFIYSYSESLKSIIAPLPFVHLSDDCLVLLPIFDASFPEICKEVLDMIILSFLMNLLVTWLPTGDKLLNWYFFRFLSVVLAICLHYLITLLLGTVLPEGFISMAPAVLVIFLIISLLLGCLKMLPGGVLALFDPMLGALYTFFFAKIAGKQVSRAMFTTALLLSLVYVLNTLQITTVSIASVTLITALPVLVLASILWYIIGKLL